MSATASDDRAPPARRGATKAPVSPTRVGDTVRQSGSKPQPKGGKQPPSLKGRRDQATRQRVIEAAISCILEQGFYRASSNAIAERAGLTWGVIQYYFGSRESLMLAVLEEGTHRLLDDLSTSDITGETLQERIEQYIAIVERYYADPEYLAFIQVLLNLSHDPRTSAQTLETMSETAVLVDAQLDRLGRTVVAGGTARDRELRDLVFQVIRGLALSEVMLGTLPFDTRSHASHFPIQRRMLAEALSLLIGSDAESTAVGRRPSASRRKRPAEPRR